MSRCKWLYAIRQQIAEPVRIGTMSEPNLTVRERKRGAILGAAVADAASLGFHWLYDQSRIRDLEPENPEFRQPDNTDYADTAGYFAHASKTIGDFSQYGEQHNTMLRALNANQGTYNKEKYESAFIECFGYGGSYSGYIDHPTRDTLNNITIAETSALTRASSIPFDGTDELKRKLITKILGNAKQFSGDVLKQKVEESIRTTDDNDQLVEHACRMLDEWNSVNSFHGSDDTQLPALSKLPALVAAYAQQENLLSVVESAVRVTNNNDNAVAFGLASANMIEAAITTGDPEFSIDAGKQAASDTTRQLIEQALASLDKSTPQVTSDWGMACQLKIGFPSAVHNIAKAGSFDKAIRENIYAGGDSCGRSILIGAVLGACYGINTERGIPLQWINKLHQSDKLLSDSEQLLAALD